MVRGCEDQVDWAGSTSLSRECPALGVPLPAALVSSSGLIICFPDTSQSNLVVVFRHLL